MVEGIRHWVDQSECETAELAGAYAYLTSKQPLSQCWQSPCHPELLRDPTKNSAAASLCLVLLRLLHGQPNRVCACPSHSGLPPLAHSRRKGTLFAQTPLRSQSGREVLATSRAAAATCAPSSDSPLPYGMWKMERKYCRFSLFWCWFSSFPREFLLLCCITQDQHQEMKSEEHKDKHFHASM